MAKKQQSTKKSSKQYDNEKSGALFVNKDKRDPKVKGKNKENWPDYKGSATLGGVDYWVSAWMTESKQGKKYMSLSFEEQADEENEEDDETQDIDDLPF